MFRAMGCPITVVAVGVGNEAFSAAMAEIRDLAELWETRYSRFRPESELSRLNDGAGNGAVRVGPELFTMIERAIEAARTTDGLFTPLVLPAVRAIGYDRDFARIRAVRCVSTGAPAPVPDVEVIVLDHTAGTIALPAGCGIDLGGIAKGAFIDAVVERFTPHWPGGCVNAGGDLRIWGEPPDGDYWTIGIEYPQKPDFDIVQARLINPNAVSAIATSGRNRRRWQTERGPAHHLIDPATGSSIKGRIETATAFAANAITADLAAKTLYLSVSNEQLPMLGSASLGLTIDERGSGTLWTTNERHDVEIVPLIIRTSETG
jgi:thiamine biosynthesis lipoprotein